MLTEKEKKKIGKKVEPPSVAPPGVQQPPQSTLATRALSTLATRANPRDDAKPRTETTNEKPSVLRSAASRGQTQGKGSQPVVCVGRNCVVCLSVVCCCSDPILSVPVTLASTANPRDYAKPRTETTSEKPSALRSAASRGRTRVKDSQTDISPLRRPERDLSTLSNKPLSSPNGSLWWDTLRCLVVS